MKNDRLFQMLYLLLDKKQISAPKLAQDLEVSVRTVYRDVETLSKAGVPIYATAGKGGGISLLPGYSFDKTLLSDDEQNQLMFAVQSLLAAGQHVEGLVQKLGTAFQKSKADWIAVDFSRWGLQQTDNQLFDLLKTAILGKKVTNITYCSSSGETSQRSIHPLKLVYKDKNWYLQAFCLKADDFRLFKMARIINTQLTDTSFTQDYSCEIPPIEMQTIPYTIKHIRLQFAKDIAFRVYDEFSSKDIVCQPDDSLIVDTYFPLDSWVISYLFSFGTNVKIIKPVYLKKQLAEYAEKILQHYKT